MTAQLSINQIVFPDTMTPAATLTGEPSNWPIIEGRVAWTVGHRGAGCLPITVGVSGHIGEAGIRPDSAGIPTIIAALGRATSTSACP